MPARARRCHAYLVDRRAGALVDARVAARLACAGTGPPVDRIGYGVRSRSRSSPLGKVRLLDGLSQNRCTGR